MKSVIVPAEVTSVEDRITASLTMKQVLILVGLLMTLFLLYVAFPRPLHLGIVKLFFMTVTGLIIGVQAVRVRGELVVDILRKILSFYFSPRYYVFDKTSSYLREDYLEDDQSSPSDNIYETARVKNLPKLKPGAGQNILNSHPVSDVYFNFNKGSINVYLKNR